MQITYELTPEDYFKFSKENAPSQSTHKSLVVVFMVLYLVFIFADVFYSLFFGSLSEWNAGAFLLSVGLRTVITFGATFLFLGIIQLYTKVAAKKASEQPQNGLFCEHRIIFNEKELIELTDVNTSRYSWKSIGEIKELESFVAINVFMSSFFIIPKRCFQNRKELNNFLETARQYQQNAENTFQLSHLIEYEKTLH